MDCPHCGKAFHDSWTENNILMIDPQVRPCIGWNIKTTVCPAWKNPTIELIQVQYSGGPQQPIVLQLRRVYPINTFRKPTPLGMPSEIKEDYEEACRVLPIMSASPIQKAAAKFSQYHLAHGP